MFFKSNVIMLDFLKAYGIVIPIWLVTVSMLGMDNFPFAICVGQSLIMLCVMYFGHVIGHFPIFENINPHILMHHKHKFLPRWLELSIESTYPFIVSFIIYKISLSTFSQSIILAVPMLYDFVHILDYSILGSDTHRQHHTYNNCNYEPIFMDVIFGTRCDNSLPYTSKNHQVIHSTMTISLVLILKLIFNLT